MENESEKMSRVSRKKREKKKWPKIVGTLLLLFTLIITYAYVRIRKTSDTIYTDLSEEELEKESHKDQGDIDRKLKRKEAFSILLMGVDTGDEGRVDRGRSDTMMVLSVNPKNKKTMMVSIPRDTRVEISGKGFEDKINHAYNFGGPIMSMNTVQNFLDIPVDYFVSVNMKGIQQIVNAVGGITVHPQLTFKQSSYSFEAGQAQKVDGAGALAYSRMRKQDPEGDYGRQARQREVVKAILDKAASFGSILKFESILKTMENNVQTNLSFGEMVRMSMNYLPALTNVEEVQMQGEGRRIDGIYYDIVSDEEKEGIQNKLKRELEVEE